MGSEPEASPVTIQAQCGLWSLLLNHCCTSNVNITKVWTASARLFASTWGLLVSVIACDSSLAADIRHVKHHVVEVTLYYVMLYYVSAVTFFIFECVIAHFLCSMHVFEVRAWSSTLGYLCAKFGFFRGLRCWDSTWRKITYSSTPSITQLIWCAGNRSAYTSEEWIRSTTSSQLTVT